MPHIFWLFSSSLFLDIEHILFFLLRSRHQRFLFFDFSTCLKTTNNRTSYKKKTKQCILNTVNKQIFDWRWFCSFMNQLRTNTQELFFYHWIHLVRLFCDKCVEYFVFIDEIMQVFSTKFFFLWKEPSERSDIIYTNRNTQKN